MFSAIWRLFAPKQEDPCDLNNAYIIINQSLADDNEPKQEPQEVHDDKYSFSYKTGVITRAEDGCFTIDDIYDFESDVQNLAVGVKVSFLVHSEKGLVTVSNLTIIDDWNYSEAAEKKAKWCSRTLITKVVQREGRKLYTDPGDVTIDLNNMTMEFIPTIGDWLEIHVKCAIDETVTDLFGAILKVDKINPLRANIIQGKVKAWNDDSKSGIINNNIYLDKDILPPTYTPAVGDEVTAEIIESDQGHCSWRALKIVPDEENMASRLKTDFEMQKMGASNYVDSHKDVDISNNIIINAKDFLEVKTCAFTILNKTDNMLILKSVLFKNINTKIKIQSPAVIKNIEIKPRAFVDIVFDCKPKSMGKTKELILFVFDGYTLGRFLLMNLVMNRNKRQGTGRYSKRNDLCINEWNTPESVVVPGQRPINAPRFIVNRLPEFPIPDKLIKIFQDPTMRADVLKANLISQKPVLNKTLCFQIYEDYFHTLLFIEEIYMKNCARIYDQERACFIKCDEYLLLEVENLTEMRPSLMVGDKIQARDPNQPNKIYDAYIHRVGAKHLYLKFDPIIHETYKGEDYSIKAVFSRTSYKKMHQAVNLALRSLGRELLFPTKVVSREPQVYFIYEPYENIMPIIGKSTPRNIESDRNEIVESPTFTEVESNAEHKIRKRTAKLIQLVKKIREEKNMSESDSSSVEEDKFIGPKQLKLKWFDNSLNYYQKEAVRNVLLGEACPLPYIIFGPPGTGKTITIVEIILQILKMIPHSRLLVCTPSNSAADLIALKLVNSGYLRPGDLVRLVAQRCVIDDMIPLRLIPYSATVSIARTNSKSPDPTILENGLRLGCNSQVIGRHRVTISTCHTAGSLYTMGIEKGHFTHFLVDEAGQANEPEIMIPLSLMDSSTSQTILAGDPMQLNPVVLSFAQSLGLAESYLERLITRFPYIKDPQGFPATGGYDPRLVTKLIYNYRSLPEVICMPNKLFYDSELKPTISETDSEEAELLMRIKEILPEREGKKLPPCLMFHGLIGDNLQTEDSPSWYNPDEVSQVFYYLNQLKRLGISFTDVGVIAPYVRQVKEIRDSLLQAEFELPKIGSVEDFQGQERKIIIMSTVRSLKEQVPTDKKHSIGFLGQPKRINVALTRAQCLTIIIGNPNLLSTDPHWKSILNFCLANGSYIGCEFQNVR